MANIYEYAGFQYEVTETEYGKVILKPVSGQHPAASKDKHLRAATELFLEHHSEIFYRREK